MIYYVDVRNYGKKGVKRDILLNVKYSKDEIRHVMEKEHIDEEIIQKMENYGIYMDREISFKAEKEMIVDYCNFDEDGKKNSYSKKIFEKKDEVTFHPDGTISWKYYYPFFSRVRFFLEDVFEKLKMFFKKKPEER